MDVALVYRQSRAEADAAAGLVRNASRRALVVQADVSASSECESVVAAVDREFGRLDAVINMASRYQAVPFDQIDEREWRRQLAVDLDGTFFCSRAAVPLLRRSGGGHIINITDWLVSSARPRYKGYLGYYVGKAGVKALTEALALELAADGIRVNAIAPGPILPPPETSERERQAVAAATPLGRWGGPEEIAGTVIALLTSGFITGESVRVDGGRHLS
jgi:NAD(P)-dependent dehydrogenase (short-subunit alcohol dehydrogenase family)